MKKIFLFAAVASLLTACNNDDNPVDEPVAVQITASIGEGSLSRASETSWDAGDTIGVTMDNLYVNLKYTTDAGDGIFGGSTMYFKNKREPVTLTAYYPYSGEEGGVPEIVKAETGADKQTAEKQKSFDFMFDKKTGVRGDQTPNVKFEFAHKMSKITLIFKSGNNGTDVSKILNYEIDGLKLEGTFNPENGVCEANPEISAQPLSISLPEGTVKDEASLSPLILFPQSLDKKVTLRITDSDNQYYECELKFKDNLLESGNNYVYTITVKKTSLSVNSTIASWVDVPLTGDASSAD